MAHYLNPYPVGVFVYLHFFVLTWKWTQMDPFGPKTGQQAGQEEDPCVRGEIDIKVKSRIYEEQRT
jgi:hypothetical protein